MEMKIRGGGGLFMCLCAGGALAGGVHLQR